VAALGPANVGGALLGRLRAEEDRTSTSERTTTP
jgi:hypothetical protein